MTPPHYFQSTPNAPWRTDGSPSTFLSLTLTVIQFTTSIASLLAEVQRATFKVAHLDLSNPQRWSTSCSGDLARDSGPIASKARGYTARRHPRATPSRLASEAADQTSSLANEPRAESPHAEYVYSSTPPCCAKSTPAAQRTASCLGNRGKDSPLVAKKCCACAAASPIVFGAHALISHCPSGAGAAALERVVVDQETERCFAAAPALLGQCVV